MTTYDPNDSLTYQTRAAMLLGVINALDPIELVPAAIDKLILDVLAGVRIRRRAGTTLRTCGARWRGALLAAKLLEGRPALKVVK